MNLLKIYGNLDCRTENIYTIIQDGKAHTMLL